MTWTKLSDDFADDCARVQLSDAAFRTHVEGLLWAMRRENSGFLTAQDLRRGCESVDLSAAVTELVNVGFWELVQGEGWQVVHHLEHQPEPDLLAKRRSDTAQRTRAYRRRQAGMDQDDDASRVTPSRDASQGASRDASRAGDGVTARVTRVGTGRDGSGPSSTTAYEAEKLKTSSRSSSRSNLRSNRPPGTPNGEILNVPTPGATVRERAYRVVGDVLGRTTNQIATACEYIDESDVNAWAFMGWVEDTIIPAIVAGSSDNEIRAQLRAARDRGDVTSAMFLTGGDDWRDGGYGWDEPIDTGA